MSVQIYFLISLFVFSLMLVGIGVWITSSNRYLGILIDSRNKMSLSRFQIVMWTLLITSAIVAYVLATGSTGFTLPTEVWAMLGISLGSTAGAVIVKGNKNAKDSTHKPPDDGEASLADLFKGEEPNDHKYVDIAKVQMFFFSLVALVGYFIAVWIWFGTDGEKGVAIGVFPALSAQLVTILGISHAGYLTVKAAPKGPQ